MSANIMAVLSRGNLELFHSAFLAWLMDPGGAHGLGPAFLLGLVDGHRSGVASQIRQAGTDYRVHTEHSVGGLRFDILVELGAGCGDIRQIVFENKVKSFGEEDQYDSYTADGRAVIPLSLLHETLAERVVASGRVLLYSHVVDVLHSMRLSPHDPHQWLVQQYRDYLEAELGVFSVLRAIGDASATWSDLRTFVRTRRSGTRHTENDTRTFSFFYSYCLSQYLERHCTDLIFGTDDYETARLRGTATGWMIEKNMTGPPFMESLVFALANPLPPFALNPDLRSLCTEQGAFIAPRIELWLDLQDLARHDSQVPPYAGRVMVGTWCKPLRAHLRRDPTYSRSLNQLGPRNFHHVQFDWSRVSFERIADTLREAMSTIGRLSAASR